MAIQHWSVTAADNDDSDATINWAEGQAASSVNNSGRAMMAVVAAWRDACGGAKTTGGTADAQTLTTGLSLSSYQHGLLLGFKAGAGLTNTGTATLAIDGLTAKTMKTPAGANLSAGQITAGGIYLCAYESSADVIIVVNAATALASTLSAIGALSVTDGNIIVGNGSTWVAESGATARTSLGLGTGDSPQFTAVNIGAASDTTLARSGAGDITIEGNAIYRAGGTDVPVTDGGTGASTEAGARTNLDVAQIPSSSTLPVGTIAYLEYSSGTAVANGNTTSGSNLRILTGQGARDWDAGTGEVQTGTWKNISGITMDASIPGFTNAIGLWVRTA